MPLKRHYGWLAVLAAVLWLVTALPIIVGYAKAGHDRAYAARVPMTAADTMAYYSDIEQARQGQWLFSNQFTSEPQRPTLFHPLWLVTGWLGNLFHLSTPWAYQAARLLAIYTFLFLLDGIVMTMVKTERERWLALLVVTTSSGLGWLLSKDTLSNALAISPDLWVAESNTFQSIAHSALFIGSQTALVAIVWSFWQWTVGQRRRLPWWLGPLTALLFLIHPYDLVTVAAIIVVWLFVCLLRNNLSLEQLKHFGLTGTAVFLCLIPVLMYFWFIVLQEPAMSGWLRQNIDTTGSFYLVLIGYGLLLPLAGLGWWVNRRRYPLATFLLVWIIVNGIIIYFPGLTFQRRLMSGLHLPIALLAAMGLLTWRTMTTSWLRPGLVGAVIVILMMTNIQNTVAQVSRVYYPDQADYPVYLTHDEDQSIRWLRDQTGRKDVIFSWVWMGNAIPGIAGRTVVVGHGHQTINLQLRLRDWAAFTTDRLSSEDRTAMLQRLHVTWLMWRQDDAMGASYQPALDPRWRQRYHNNTVQLFQLQLD